MREWLRAILVTIALAASSAARPADADEDWIERFMSQPGQSAQPMQIRRGYKIAWSELKRFVGVPVKVLTDSGRVHRGYIERAGADGIVLRSELHSGYAELQLRPDQVVSTELE